jgi:hypothetical protein
LAASYAERILGLWGGEDRQRGERRIVVGACRLDIDFEVRQS